MQNQMSRGDHAIQRGFTIVELLVVLAIMALLVSILVPSLTAAREITRTVQCNTNQRQIGLADAAYNNDNKEWFLYGGDWVAAAAQYTGTGPEFYHAQNGAAGIALNLKAAPFKCPLVSPTSGYGTYLGFGYGVACIESTVDPYYLTAGAPTNFNVTDYCVGSGIHGRSTQPSSTPGYLWRRTNDVVHVPSQILSFADTQPGVGVIDSNTFGCFARHQNYAIVTLLYADGHAIAWNPVSTTPSLGNNAAFYRSDNVTVKATAPYFYW